jgi:hypothetical protein
MIAPTRLELKRFFQNVRKVGGCWVWVGSVTSGGYGQFRFRGKMRKSHRFLYEFMTGKRLGFLLACHTCDNPPCVRPDHIFPGTHWDNMRDMVAKGRQSKLYGNSNGMRKHPERIQRGDRHYSRRLPELVLRGTSNGRACLSEGTIRNIRRLYQQGFTQYELAKIYRVSQPTIHRLLVGKTYA